MTSLSESEKQACYEEILLEITNSLPKLQSKQEMFDLIIKKLSALPHFNWTGIYEYNTQLEELQLYPKYIGLPTDHIKIPKGKGVCGTAVAQNQDIIVEDVNELDNYLACSVGTRAELVVLIKTNDGNIIGQIDVDSDERGAFSDLDQQYTAKIAQILAHYIQKL